MTSIKKHANELKVHEKTVKTTIKQELCTDFNLLDYTIWGVLENKTGTTSNPNIGSLKTAIVLTVTPHKTPTVRPPASYHENYSS